MVARMTSGTYDHQQRGKAIPGSPQRKSGALRA